MEDQMKFAFMQQGGVLRDDGMNTDPVSGNEVPSGSMAKEVRDDIDAKLSEGEYVVPADVVRFHGVQKFEELRNQAKQGFGRMERDGRIGGEPVDDDFPIPVNQLQTFDQGGDTTTYEQTFGQPFQMGQRYGDMGAATNTGYELITYTSPDGQRTIVIPHFNGRPMSAVPTGFAPQGAGSTGGGSVGMTDDEDRADAMELQRRRTADRGMSDLAFEASQRAMRDDVPEQRPKAVEDFTGQDFATYVQQTKGFGIDDIARNVPILGELLSRQDGKIRERAQEILKSKEMSLSTGEFEAMKDLATTPPQRSFLGELFGGKVPFTPDKSLADMKYTDYLGRPDTKLGYDTKGSPYETEDRKQISDTPKPREEKLTQEQYKDRVKTAENKVVEQARQDADEARDDVLRQGGSVEEAFDAAQTAFTGFDQAGNYTQAAAARDYEASGRGGPNPFEMPGMNEGGLASKPKAKPKRKRTTKKGLGVKKTKAT
jgi:hypothetical protein